MFIIELTQNKVCLIDEEDWPKLRQYKWYYSDTGYAMRAIWLGRDPDGTKHMKHVRMHREIINAPDHMQVDHINRNRLDNRKANLRLATSKDNKGNAELRFDNTSGYKGVAWHKKGKKWQCAIWIKGERQYLGLFDTKEEAALAYNKAAITYFGEFANCNII